MVHSSPFLPFLIPMLFQTTWIWIQLMVERCCTIWCRYGALGIQCSGFKKFLNCLSIHCLIEPLAFARVINSALYWWSSPGRYEASTACGVFLSHSHDCGPLSRKIAAVTATILHSLKTPSPPH